jgi:uncharacterized cupredoxin-like copper-binding protein
MKTILFVSVTFATAISLAQADDKKSDKTLGEKTAITLEKIGEKTKETGRSVAEGTKKAAKSAVDAVTPDKDARKVEVKLTEGKIDMPKSLASGKTALVVTNKGKQKHNFEITGPGVDETFNLDLSPNETKTLHVDLKPGSYQVACPVFDHDEKNMQLTLTVK